MCNIRKRSDIHIYIYRSYLPLRIEAFIHGDPDLLEENGVNDGIDFVAQKLLDVLLDLGAKLLVVAD